MMSSLNYFIHNLFFENSYLALESDISERNVSFNVTILMSNNLLKLFHNIILG